MLQFFLRQLLWLASVVALAAVIVLVVLGVNELFKEDTRREPSMAFDQSSGIGLRIVAPLNGRTVSAPFTLEVESVVATIADPAEGIPGAMHYHVLIDQHPFPASGEVIPEDENSFHFWSDSFELDLSPGFHSLTIIFGDNDHVRPLHAPAKVIGVTVKS